MSLAEARDARRLRDYQQRLRTVVETNKKALSRLFQTGLIYSRQGARLGRDLLLAHQHLLRVGQLLSRLGDLAAGADEGERGEAESLHREVQKRLARTTALTARSDGLLARER